MHGHHCALHIGGERFEVFAYETEIRDVYGVVVLEGIGIDAEEVHVSGVEGKVGISEHVAVDIGTGAQTVVVAKECNVGHAEVFEDVALHFEFAGHSKVRQVAAVEHKVDVVSCINTFHCGFCLVVPSLSVADENKAYGLFSGRCGLNAFDVLRIDVAFPFHPRIVGMVVDEFAGGKGCASEKEYSLRNPKKYLV